MGTFTDSRTFLAKKYAAAEIPPPRPPSVSGETFLQAGEARR